MQAPTAIVFIDGENLITRYQKMLADGAVPKDAVRHKEDEFLWHPEISHLTGCTIKRIGFYTTKTGDNDSILELADEISRVKYNHPSGFGFLNPHVFKKARRGQKTKSVDINIVTDFLRHTFNNSVDHVLLLSGDGDYLPTIEESMRHGVHVSVGAFSSGLNKNLRSNVDEFFDLDSLFFQPVAPLSQETCASDQRQGE